MHLMILVSRLILLLCGLAHLWTVFIAFSNGGFLWGIISLIFPILAEIYWVIRLFGENNAYSITIIVLSVLLIPASAISKN